jgi:hypothetical protein
LKLNTKFSKLTQGMTERLKFPYSDEEAEIAKRSKQRTGR